MARTRRQQLRQYSLLILILFSALALSIGLRWSQNLRPLFTGDGELTLVERGTLLERGFQDPDFAAYDWHAVGNGVVSSENKPLYNWRESRQFTPGELLFSQYYQESASPAAACQDAERRALQNAASGCNSYGLAFAQLTKRTISPDRFSAAGVEPARANYASCFVRAYGTCR